MRWSKRKWNIVTQQFRKFSHHFIIKSLLCGYRTHFIFMYSYLWKLVKLWSLAAAEKWNVANHYEGYCRSVSSRGSSNLLYLIGWDLPFEDCTCLFSKRRFFQAPFQMKCVYYKYVVEHRLIVITQSSEIPRVHTCIYVYLLGSFLECNAIKETNPHPTEK